MGYMRHHAIVVTGSYGEHIFAAHSEALDILGSEQVSPVSDKAINSHRSFCVFPDGSKEGWDDSDRGDDNRGEFIRYLDGLRYDDGSSPLRWVEVQFGDDERETKVTAHSDEDERRTEKPDASRAER